MVSAAVTSRPRQGRGRTHHTGTGIATRLSRITTSGRYIPEIDGLRFVAISSVFLFHLATDPALRHNPGYDVARHSPLLASVLGAGNFGVQAFFVISGFVLAIPFVRHTLLAGPKVRLRSYYLRRLTRLEPPYIVAMIGCYFLLITTTTASPVALLPHLAAGFGYLHNITFGVDNPVNRVAWSLEVEVQFYLLVPLLALVFRIRGAHSRRLVLVAAILLCAAVGPLLAARSPHARDTLVSYAQYFLAGFLLADLDQSDRLRPSRRALLWDGAAGVAVVVIVLGQILVGQRLLPAGTASPLETIGRCALPLACIVAYCGVFKGVLLRRALTTRWVTLIGGMCYSIYLLHDVVLQRLLPVSTRALGTGDFAIDVTLQVLIAATAVLAVSVAYFLRVERPCMDRNWPTRLRRWVGGTVMSGGIVMPMSKDQDIRARIGELIAEEHQLRRSLARSEISGSEEHQRLTAIETQLDQCWDLLRQRDAAREFGTDPDAAAVRDAATVENYLD